MEPTITKSKKKMRGENPQNFLKSSLPLPNSQQKLAYHPTSQSYSSPATNLSHLLFAPIMPMTRSMKCLIEQPSLQSLNLVKQNNIFLIITTSTHSQSIKSNSFSGISIRRPRLDLLKCCSWCVFRQIGPFRDMVAGFGQFDSTTLVAVC